MKFIVFFLFLFTFNVYAQFPSGGGNFPEYKAAKIKSLTKKHITYSDSTENDTTFQFKQEFDEKGNMIKERFECVYSSNCYYEYYYNEYGFLVEIDTNGFFGYGYANGGEDSLTQTLVQEIRITKDGRQVMKEVRYNHTSGNNTTITSKYDENGHLVRRIYFDDAPIKSDTKMFVTLYAYNSDGHLLTECLYSAYTTEVVTEAHLIHKYLYDYEKF